jgi:hypothetical protein
MLNFPPFSILPTPSSFVPKRDLTEKAKIKPEGKERTLSYVFRWGRSFETIRPKRCFRTSSLTANGSWRREGDAEAAEMQDLLPPHFAPLVMLKRGNLERNTGFASN